MDKANEENNLVTTTPVTNMTFLILKHALPCPIMVTALLPSP